MATPEEEQRIRDLAAKADHGMGGQGAIVEMLAIFKDGIDLHVAAANRLNKTMTYLAGVGVLLVVVQIALAFWGKC